MGATSDISDVTWTAELSHWAGREVSQAGGLGGRLAPPASVSLAAKWTDGIGFVFKILVYLEIGNSIVRGGTH